MLKERWTVAVGAVQVEARPGEIVVNLAHATPFVEQAVAQGANVVVLPEVFSGGYVPNQAVCAQIGYAYAPNRWRLRLFGDPRDTALRTALDRCLEGATPGRSP